MPERWLNMLKRSKFNVLISDFPSKDEFLIFNTFTDSRVVINQELKVLVDDIDNRLSFTREEKTHLETLSDLGFVLDESIDEDRELEYWFQKRKFNTDTLDLTVLTTSACNLGCSYCFEDGIDLKGFMNEEMCQKFLLWADRKMATVRPRVLHLTLFGGEPLLNMKAVYFLSRSLDKMTKARGVKLEISIITNGILLSEELVDILMPLGLKRIKVTIDGNEAAHDSKRHYKNGKGSYRKIMDNLIALKGKAPISIGGNFDETTKDSIPRFLDELVDLGFTSGDIQDISFKPILSPTNERKVLNNSMDSGHGCTFSEMKVDDILWLRNEVKDHGFKEKSDGIALGPCCATFEHTYAVDPWGKVYKCAALVGREEFATGDLEDEDEDNYQNTRFMTVDLWEDPMCKPCAYRPICGGGCRGSSVTQSNDFEKPACEKLYFENVALELLKHEYLQETALVES